MWQHHYLLHVARMDALRAKAERERRWHLQNAEHGRWARPAVPGRARAALARWLVAGSRIGERLARRLDERVAIELGPERLVRDA